MPTWHTFHGTHGWEVDGTGTRVPRYRLTGDHPLSQRRFGAARRRSAQRMLIYVQLPAVDHTKPTGPERLLLPLEQLGFALGAIGRVSVGAETKMSLEVAGGCPPQSGPTRARQRCAEVGSSTSSGSCRVEHRSQATASCRTHLAPSLPPNHPPMHWHRAGSPACPAFACVHARVTLTYAVYFARTQVAPHLVPRLHPIAPSCAPLPTPSCDNAHSIPHDESYQVARRAQARAAAPPPCPRLPVRNFMKGSMKK